MYEEFFYIIFLRNIGFILPIFMTYTINGSLVIEHSLDVWNVMGLIPYSQRSQIIKFVIEASLFNAQNIKGSSTQKILLE